MTTDPFTTELMAATAPMRAGDKAASRIQLQALWDRIVGNAVHEFVLAHQMADAQDDPKEELAWDLRALASAERCTNADVQRHYPQATLASFMPSLHINLAEDYFKLGDREQSKAHLTLAQSFAHHLGPDAYGDMLRRGIARMAKALGGSRRLRTAADDYRQVRDAIDGWLGYPENRWPIIIGVDGPDGIGKSTFASWLGWQLGIPVVHLDMFLVRNADVFDWRATELRNVIGSRISARDPKPLIVEGALLLKALAQIGMTTHRLIWLTNTAESDGLSEQRSEYQQQFRPKAKADLTYQLTFAHDD